MNAALVARVLPGSVFEWGLLDGSSALVSPVRGDAESLIGACAQHELALLLDGRGVGTLPASIPAKTQRQARVAAPYAIEDEVTEELDALYVTCGPAEEEGVRTVGFIRKSDLDALLAPLAEAHITVRCLRPDYLALPWTPGQWSVLSEGDRLLVRTAAHQGFVVDNDIAAEVFARKLEEGPPERIVQFGDGPLPAALEALPYTRQALPGGPWSLLAKGVVEPVGIDWLPDSFPRPRTARRVAWSWAAGLLGMALTLHVGFLLAGNSRLTGQISGLREAQAEVMRTAFPEITRIVNAEIQATQAVAALRGAGTGEASVLELLHGLGLARGEDTGRLRLLSLNFADGVMSVQALAPDIASLEGLGAEGELPIAIEILSVENRQDGVVGNLRITIKEAAP
ncbi:MAG: hypothetical protein RL434_312 [Pseudomonadota bacterium]|jgi:general secretion pathway protein L